MLSLIFAVLNMLSGVTPLPSGLWALVLGVVELWYLTRPHVVAYFKGQPPASANPESPPPV